MNASLNRALYLRWVRETFPEAYEMAAAQAIAAPDAGFSSGQLSGLWDSITSAFEKFTSALPNIAQTYTDVKAQIDWLRLNTDRAKQGLPPLDPKTGQPLIPSTVTAPPANSQAAQIEQHIAGSGTGVPAWVWIAGAAGIVYLATR